MCTKLSDFVVSQIFRLVWCGAWLLKLVVSCQRRSKLSETFDMVKSTGFCTICLLQPISLSILDQSKSVARKALAHLPTATRTLVSGLSCSCRFHSIFSNLWLPRSGRRFPVAVVSLYSCRTRGGTFSMSCRPGAAPSHSGGLVFLTPLNFPWSFLLSN